MNKARKLFALLIAMLMAVVLALPAFADEGVAGTESGSTEASTYTITINSNTENHTYQAYQIFAGDLSDGVLSNIEWGSGVKNGTALLNALKSDETIGTYFTECTTAADVANVLQTATTDGEGDEEEQVSVFASNSANLDAFAAVVGKTQTTGEGPEAITTTLYLKEATGTSSTPSKKTDGEKEIFTYTIGNLPAGYYFVKDSQSVTGNDAQTKFMLKLVKSITVTPKSAVPSVEKKVQEDDKYNQNDGYGSGYNDVADWNIGDSVPFKLIGTLPSNLADYDSYKYVFHDTLSNGLTLDTDSVEVYVANSKNADLSKLTPLTPVTTDNSDGVYTLNTNPSHTISEQKKCSFEVSFNDVKSVEGVTASSYIIVTYTATLNTNAEIGLDGNPNEVYLEFSNNPNQGGEGDTGTTPPDKVIVFTYELDTTKVDGEDNDTKLENAQFVLLNEAKNKVAKVNAETNKFEGWIDMPNDTDNDGKYSYNEWSKYNESNHVILTSDESGLFKVIGLDDGTYQLREIKAPDGYNLMNGDVTIKITATTANGQDWTKGDASEALTKLEVTANSQPGTGDTSKGIVDVTIANNKGSTLPETGGMGTTLFYIIGGVLVVGAGVLLITKKRMGNHSEQ